MRADELGWQGLGNGALPDIAEQAGFELARPCRTLFESLAHAQTSGDPDCLRVDFVHSGQFVRIDIAAL